jgi:RNA-directed DNA polymerase
VRHQFYALAQNAAPGVDRRTWKDYEANLEHNIEDLHQRVQRGAYRALPSVSRMPKRKLENGEQR